MKLGVPCERHPPATRCAMCKVAAPRKMKQTVPPIPIYASVVRTIAVAAVPPIRTPCTPHAAIIRRCSACARTRCVVHRMACDRCKKCRLKENIA
jgi:hypothetical protein